MMDIVVASCAKYSDCWAPFVALFRKFWINCPFPLTLITDKAQQPWHGDRVIAHGVDLFWSANLRVGLCGLPTEHVLLLQEDFFFCEPVEQEFIRTALHKMQIDPSIACLRLYPCPGSDRNIDDDIGEIDINAPYRVSCQAAIWRKDYLVRLLQETGDTADFELRGTPASRKFEGRFLSVRRDRPHWPIYYLCSAVSRGRWNPDALALCKKHKIRIDTTQRPIEGE